MKKLSFTRVVLFLVAMSCSSNDDTPTTPQQGVKRTVVIESYAEIVSANYEKALQDAQLLNTSITNFVAAPTDANFTAAKNAWLTARESYGTTEAFRFAEGPIDIDDNAPEALLNSWPLDENYIDYVAENENSGIINNPQGFPTLSKDVLTNANQFEDNEASVSVGYHAIEFLLWGQDLTAPSQKIAGQRPYTDYVDGGTAANQDRRRAYLSICAELIVDHLQLLVNQWSTSGSYRATFLALNENTALRNILTGIATLSKSELAGERMFTAYDNVDQEDEHSCFSDNTNRDIRLNLQGVINVYNANYNTINGTSLSDLINEANPSLGAEITAALNEANSAVNATANPFDFAISNEAERPKVLAAVQALIRLGDKLVEGGASIGVSINI